MAGSIKNVSLVGLLQFLSQSGQSGVLCLEFGGDRGRIWLSNGQIVFAHSESAPQLPPRRAFSRLLRANTGTFSLNPPEEHPAGEEMSQPAEILLLEVAQELEERNRLETGLPPLSSKLAVASLDSLQLRKLAPTELFILGLVRTRGTIQGVLDNYAEGEEAAAKLLSDLLQRKVITVVPEQ
jgi:hypothetical protein